MPIFTRVYRSISKFIFVFLFWLIFAGIDRTLMVGMTIVELENISGSIVIDSVLQEAYQGTTLMNDHMNGEFPVLKPGANAISWTGAVTKVVVRPNWRYL